MEIIADFISSVGPRIVATDDEYNTSVFCYPTDGLIRRLQVLRLTEDGARRQSCTVPKSPEYDAYIAGTMPPYAIADWLEENVPDVPPEALAILRLPYNPRPVVTAGRNASG